MKGQTKAYEDNHYAYLHSPPCDDACVGDIFNSPSNAVVRNMAHNASIMGRIQNHYTPMGRGCIRIRILEQS
jgi:hypothetical protein